MQFIEVSNGRLYPISAIERIVPLQRKEGEAQGYLTHRIILTDGWEALISQHEVSAIRRAGAKIIPAQPAYFLLTFAYDSDPERELDPFVHKDPIIAFRVGEYGGLDPVTLDWEFTEMGFRHGVLHPDGGVYSAGDAWEDVDKWTAFQTSEAEQERERKRSGDG